MLADFIGYLGQCGGTFDDSGEKRRMKKRLMATLHREQSALNAVSSK
jgi:hypothetical protein